MRSSSSSCNICKKDFRDEKIEEHILRTHPDVHPSIHVVQVLLKRQLFTLLPYMACRLCDYRIILPSSVNYHKMMEISNAWGKEHVTLYHADVLQKLVVKSQNSEVGF